MTTVAEKPAPTPRAPPAPAPAAATAAPLRRRTPSRPAAEPVETKPPRRRLRRRRPPPATAAPPPAPAVGRRVRAPKPLRRAAARRPKRGSKPAPQPAATRSSRPPPRSSTRSRHNPQAGGGASYRSRTISEAQGQFTGEPISLDLKDADIKDVFRTISQLTGLNIVIDPEVRGTVTVQLEDVPWDQALDLILKQNSLGYVLENNIMRIATTAKLQAEEGDRARLAEARQAAEPTRTVIKKLSYAKAARDRADAPERHVQARRDRRRRRARTR